MLAADPKDIAMSHPWYNIYSYYHTAAKTTGKAMGVCGPRRGFMCVQRRLGPEQVTGICSTSGSHLGQEFGGSSHRVVSLLGLEHTCGHTSFCRGQLLLVRVRRANLAREKAVASLPVISSL